MKLKKCALFVLTFFYSCTYSYATWSIIVIDPTTKEIGIAGASCTYNCYGIGRIVPGIGAVIVQAMSNSQAREKGVEMILSEADPEQIILAMRNPLFDPEKQQYAIVTVKYIGKPVTYTGDSTKTYRGTLIANGVSVQGNTLTNADELKIILDAVVNGQRQSLHIIEVLMTALEAGSKAGGDKRCGEQKAMSAFIIVAKPDSKGLYLDLNVFGQGKGAQNAVDMLRQKLERWKRKHLL